VGTFATEGQIRQVLANVTELRIREEYGWGADDCGLDNVMLLAGHTPWLQIVCTNSQVTLILHTLRLGQTYRLEQTPALVAPASWQPVQTFTADAATWSLVLPMTNTALFYRAQSELP
jgi:hypothetical protein